MDQLGYVITANAFWEEVKEAAYLATARRSLVSQFTPGLWDGA